MRDSNNKIVKTLDRGICEFCKQEVVWKKRDYFTTTKDNENICVSSDSLDHEPLTPKSENFNSLYNKLLG